jgi:SecD/SecF fusion protein
MIGLCGQTNLRRLGLVALVAASAVAGTACGGQGGDDGAQDDRLRREGGLAVRYESAVPSPAASDVREAAAVLQRRVADRDGARAVATPTGVELQLPGVSRVDEATLPRHLVPIAFYDWEPNVIGPDGEPDPANPTVTGGPAAGTPVAALPLYEAVARAEARPAVEDADNLWPAPVYYAVSARTRTAEGPFDLRGEAARVARDRRGRVATVGPGTAIVRGEQPDDIAEDEKGDEWYVLDDDVALSGRDLTNPEQNFAQGPGGNGDPIVAFDFTARGREAWERVTKEIAARGRSQQLPGASPVEAAQHFAVVLDNEIISAPFVDFRQNPDGISGANGSQIQGGFTIQSAQDLAKTLEAGAGPLPLRRASVRRIPPQR